MAKQRMKHLFKSPIFPSYWDIYTKQVDKYQLALFLTNVLIFEVSIHATFFKRKNNITHGNTTHETFV